MKRNTYFVGLLRILLCSLACCYASIARTESPDATHLDVLRMGFYYPSISQIADRADILVSMDFWMQELSHSFGMVTAPVQLFDDIKDMAQAFESNSINMIIAPPLSIALHFNRHVLAECMLATRRNNKLDSLLLIARASDKNLTINDLKGRHVLVPDNDELSDLFLNLLTLRAAHLPYDKFFTKVSTGKQAKRMLLDLFFDKADAAIINQATFDLMLELNPQVGTKVKIIDSYPLKSRNYSFVRADFPQRDILRQSFLQVGDTVRGQQVLTLYQQEVMAFCDVQDLNAFDALVTEYQQLTHKHKNAH